jgi:1,4-dihydroxy-6-naphthoate synthase
VTKLIRIAHSPDADDAFMHYAVIKGKVAANGLRFVETLADIETLNQKAREGVYEVTAISLHAYAYLDERYALLNSGASLGDGYGPIVIAGRRLRREDLAGAAVATPGKLTSARLALQLWQPDARCTDMPFDAVMDAVRRGDVDAGVIIHEGQLTFEDEGFEMVGDLGAWWTEETATPLPLGGNAIRRDLGADVIQRVATVLESSIRYALAHREVGPCPGGSLRRHVRQRSHARLRRARPARRGAVHDACPRRRSAPARAHPRFCQGLNLSSRRLLERMGQSLGQLREEEAQHQRVGRGTSSSAGGSLCSRDGRRAPSFLTLHLPAVWGFERAHP